MKIAINAISIKDGGSAVVLEQLLAEFVRQRPNCEYHVIVNTRLSEFAALAHPSVRVHRFPWAERNFACTIAWYLVALPRWLARERMDVLFSQTNYLPLTSRARTVLLLQNASYFCPEFYTNGAPSFVQRFVAGLKKQWVRRSLLVADHPTVQTHAFAAWVRAALPQLGDRLVVITHGPSYLNRSQPPAAPPRRGECLRLLYVCKYGEQKNFHVIFRALSLLRAAGIGVQLDLTLEERLPGTQAVLAAARRLGVADMVINRGDLGHSGVLALYAQAHVFVWASICESFGLPMLEAMGFGLPLVAADAACNREICGDAASYFARDDERALAASVDRLYRDEAQWKATASGSRQQLRRFDWGRAAAKTLDLMLEDAPARSRQGVHA